MKKLMFCCFDCGSPRDSGLMDYMVHRSVWFKAQTAKRVRFLCVRCLSTSAPINRKSLAVVDAVTSVKIGGLNVSNVRTC